MTFNPNAQRSSRRISITIPDAVWDKLVDRSNDQGRSISNLAAFLLEASLLTAHFNS